MSRALLGRSVLMPARLLVFGFLALVSPTSDLCASPPHTLHAQGILRDELGSTVAGVVTVEFRLYAQSAGGVPLATETRTLTVTDGLYDVHLDTLGNPDLYRDAGGNNENWYFGVSVEGETELSPRMRFGSVPHAHIAGTIEGDVYTSPGELTVRALQDPDKHVEMIFRSEPDSAVVVVLDSNKTTAATGRYVLRAGIPLRADMALDSDGDGESEGGIESSMIPAVSSVAINTKGTGADKNRTASTTTITPDSGSLVIDHDSDDDGVSEEEISFAMVPGTSAVAIKTRGTGADKNRTASTTTIAPDSGSLVIDHDSDDDGVSEEEISLLMVPGTTAVAIKTRGTGADKNRVASTTTVTPDSGSMYMDHDSDDDGISEEEISFAMVPGTAAVAIKTKGTGADKNRVIVTSDSLGPKLSLSIDDGDEDPEEEIEQFVVPGTCSVAIKTKGTGADKNRVISSTHPDSAVHEVISADSKESIAMRVREAGDGTPGSASVSVAHDDPLLGSGSVTMFADVLDSYVHLTDDGVTAYSMSTSSGIQIQNGSGVVSSSIDRDGVASFATRLGVGTVPTTHPIEHSSGAHLTAGGTWANSSDANLKENFEEVDGRELLDRLAEMPISRWNYKSEGSAVPHIGPTAQDFQKAFGVGSDGKSISTIDPSGIALAAIQELHRENQELRWRNESLESRFEALLKKVELLERDLEAK